MTKKRKHTPKPGTVASTHPIEQVRLLPSTLSFKERLKIYLPGIILFLIALIIGLFIYKDYGISWDEDVQRNLGIINYEYIFHNKQDLFTYRDRNYGASFELFLVGIEKLMRITDMGQIYQMRHLVTHIFFLSSAFSAYFVIMKLFNNNNFIACLGFIMLVFAPRIYAHSFLNSKDIPFLSMFLITVSFCYLAFNKNKPWLYFILGALCGLTTGIRVMGIMLCVFIVFFLFIDIISGYKNKAVLKKNLLNLLFFSASFCLFLYASWPYLWENPVGNFIESFDSFSRFGWNGLCLLNGTYYHGSDLPWTYFPTWFLITNPVLWLVAGTGGIFYLSMAFLKKPMTFLKNTKERNFLLYALCFAAPIAAIFFFHSVLYDDWRHLYFIYPCFVFIGLYFINKLLTAIQSKYRVVIQSLCLLQVALIGYFMVSAHPLQQVYFNELVSHKSEYLRENYELDYWGSSYKQGVEYLLATSKADTIKVCSANINESDYCYMALQNNIFMLNENDRKRVQFCHYSDADYFITIFFNHNQDYPIPDSNIVHQISLFNSTILRIFKMPENKYMRAGNLYATQKQYDSAIVNFKKALMLKPDFSGVACEIAKTYYLKNNFDSTIWYYKQAINSDPVNAAIAMNNLEAVCILKKDYATAITYSQKAITLNPKDAGAYSNLGRASYFSGQYKDAIEAILKELDLDKKTIDICYVALSYQKLGNMTEAHKYEALAKQYYANFKLE